MKVRLNDIDLVLASTDDGERYEQDLRTILSMSTQDKRRLVELPVLGSVGILQDMGTEPVKISFEGEMTGTDVSSTIQELNKLYEKGEDVSFESSFGLISEEEVTMVRIENFQVKKTVGTDYHYSYTMDLREHRQSMQP